MHWLRLSWSVFRATVSKGWVNNWLWKAGQSWRKGNREYRQILSCPKEIESGGGCGRRAEVNTVFCSLFGSVLHSKQNWEAAWSMASDKRPLWKLIRAARPKEMKEHSYCRRDTPISLCVRAINHSTLHTTEEFNECELWRGQGHDRIIKAKIKVSPLVTTNHWNKIKIFSWHVSQTSLLSASCLFRQLFPHMPQFLDNFNQSHNALQ